MSGRRTTSGTRWTPRWTVHGGGRSRASSMSRIPSAAGPGSQDKDFSVESAAKSSTATNEELTWLMDDFVNRVAGIDRAAVLSSDGILIGRSSALSREDGEHLSAVAAAF